LCVTPSDVALKINHSQVPVLPNFAMTDYASQGKTQYFNVVDLSGCCNHMSYYTSLSRGSTAEGTVIVQGFNPHKIMCGASGYLQQEFRELELLDEITKLSYEGILPNCWAANPTAREGATGLLDLPCVCVVLWCS
jgi:hypothetical protein